MLRNLVVPCMLDPLPGREVEVDEFQVCALPPLALRSWKRRHDYVLPVHVRCRSMCKQSLALAYDAVSA